VGLIPEKMLNCFSTSQGHPSFLKEVTQLVAFAIKGFLDSRCARQAVIDIECLHDHSDCLRILSLEILSMLLKYLYCQVRREATSNVWHFIHHFSNFP